MNLFIILIYNLFDIKGQILFNINNFIILTAQSKYFKKITEMKKEECLRILKEMSTQKDVPGGISNRMYSDLRRKFPWHFLMFSWNNKSERVIEVHKRLLIEQYQAKIEILLKSELTQEDVDDLELINESLVNICNRKTQL